MLAVVAVLALVAPRNPQLIGPASKFLSVSGLSEVTHRLVNDGLRVRLEKPEHSAMIYLVIAFGWPILIVCTIIAAAVATAYVLTHVSDRPLIANSFGRKFSNTPSSVSMKSPKSSEMFSR